MIYVWYMGTTEEIEMGDTSHAIGFVSTEDFLEIYNFWAPNSLSYLKKGLCLRPVDFDAEIMNASYFRSSYNNSKLSYKFANWDKFWEWIILETL